MCLPTVNKTGITYTGFKLVINAFVGSNYEDEMLEVFQSSSGRAESCQNLGSTSIASFHASHLHEVEGGISGQGARLWLVFGKDRALLVVVIALVVLGT